jgi:hypothetical protein
MEAEDTQIAFRVDRAAAFPASNFLDLSVGAAGDLPSVIQARSNAVIPAVPIFDPGERESLAR